jgi:hypothetical protein
MKRIWFIALLIASFLSPWIVESFHTCDENTYTISQTQHDDLNPTVKNNCDFCKIINGITLNKIDPILFLQTNSPQSFYFFYAQLSSSENIFARSARGPPALI